MSLASQWQISFFDHIIRKDEDLMAVIRYILKPVGEYWMA